MSPESPNRAVTPQEEQNLREFCHRHFRALADAPIVIHAVCMYLRHATMDIFGLRPIRASGLIVAAGDSGHGFKFAPVLGEIIADAVEEKANPLLQKFRWRPEIRAGNKRGRGSRP
jgi:glycine/D-amino acid oxidase-like deaminating enzyme